jgi:hypothetical protein
MIAWSRSILVFNGRKQFPRGRCDGLHATTYASMMDYLPSSMHTPTSTIASFLGMPVSIRSRRSYENPSRHPPCSPSMVHNHEASDNDTRVEAGEQRLLNLNLKESMVLHRTGLLVLPYYRLPHGWNLSNGGYTVSPLPEGVKLCAFITERWARPLMCSRTTLHGHRKTRSGWPCFNASGRQISLTSSGPAPSASTRSVGDRGGTDTTSTRHSSSTDTAHSETMFVVKGPSLHSLGWARAHPDREVPAFVAVPAATTSAA